MTVRTLDSDWIDLSVLFLLLRKLVWLLIAMIIIGGGCGYFIGLKFKPLFLSESRLLQSSSKSISSQLASYSILMGGSIDAFSGGSNDQNYASILYSDAVLDRICSKKYPRYLQDSTTLMHFWGIDTISYNKKAPHLTIEQQRQIQLRLNITEALKIQVNKGIIILEAEIADPVLATALNAASIESLRWYNETMRRSSAIQKMEFLETKEDEYQTQLHLAERTLASFTAQNKTIGSPLLDLRQKQLIREVEVSTQLNLEFRKQLEMAKVEVARESFSFSILNYPSEPLRPSWPRKKLMVAGGMLVGLILFAIIVGIMLYWRGLRNA